MHERKNEVKPKAKLWALRAEMIRQGVTIQDWCRDAGVSRPTLYRAIGGDHVGPKARTILAQLSTEFGVAL